MNGRSRKWRRGRTRRRGRERGRGRREKEKEKAGRFLLLITTVLEAYNSPTKRLPVLGGCGVWRLAIKSKFKVLYSIIPISVLPTMLPRSRHDIKLRGSPW